MAVKPDIQKLSATSPQILNTIRANASPYYQSAVPYAEGTTASIRTIGNVIMQYQPLQNEFLSALVNRIGRVIITSKLYDNPWSFVKKGMLEFGETVEEIFVNIAKPHSFDPTTAETEVFKREIPDVRAAFHTMNYQKFYKSTVSNDQLRQAFLSWNGITDLIAKIVDAMYTGANYDEFLTMKYLIFKMATAGNIHTVGVNTAAENLKSTVATIKSNSNLLSFLSPNYNMAGVKTFTLRDDQFIFLNSKFDATVDVEVLAAAFNMDRAEFYGHRVLVDSFGALDTARLDELFKDDPSYTTPAQAELTAMDNVVAVVVDRDWFMCFDNFYEFTENYNGQGLYWNYFYHVWKTFSVSPFANAILYTTDTPAVTAVTVNPPTVTVPKGNNQQFTAAVTTTGFAPQTVTWKVTGASTVTSTIDSNGVLRVPAGEKNTTLTVTATSTFDSTKSNTSTVTLS